jgi:hypothetical protein
MTGIGVHERRRRVSCGDCIVNEFTNSLLLIDRSLVSCKILIFIVEEV